MSKWANDDVLDALLNEVADNGDEMFICSQQPTTYAEASSTYKLAGTTLTKGVGNGDYSIANGDSSGRKLTVAQQSDINVETTGDATHIAICDSVNSKLLIVTTCTTQTLTAGNTVTVPAWDEEVADPT